MSMYPQNGMNTLDYGYADTGERSRVVTQFFNSIYMYMAIALMWTAVVSAACAMLPALRLTMNPGLSVICMLGAFAISFATRSAAMRLGIGAGLALFLLYATLIGVAIAPIWVVYHQATIGIAFLLTGGVFFATSLVGFVTKLDLSKVGAIAVMIAFGLFFASIINYFVASNMLSWIVTYAVVLIFPIIIAWQTQSLREFALANGGNGDLAGRVAVVGALSLYIAFINIFLSILRIMGDRR